MVERCTIFGGSFNRSFSTSLSWLWVFLISLLTPLRAVSSLVISPPISMVIPLRTFNSVRHHALLLSFVSKNRLKIFTSRVCHCNSVVCRRLTSSNNYFIMLPAFFASAIRMGSTARKSVCSSSNSTVIYMSTFRTSSRILNHRTGFFSNNSVFCPKLIHRLTSFSKIFMVDVFKHINQRRLIIDDTIMFGGLFFRIGGNS